MSARLWVAIAGLTGALGVALGAFHAHGLEEYLQKRIVAGEAFTAEEAAAELQKQMHNCDVAVRYQMYHALALLGVGLLAVQRPSTAWSLAGLALLLGVALFSGGLYLMVFAGEMLHWAIIPSGGLLLIIGWMLVGFAGLLSSPRPA